MQADEPPQVGGVRFGPMLAGVLYALLVISAALALWVRRFPGELPEILETVAPWLFLVFVVVFASYRLRLMRSGKYPAFKGFFQIGVAVLFFTLLLPQAKQPFEESASDIEVLLVDPNPRVRALAAEVARHRNEAPTYAPLLVRALGDRDARVRDEAHRSLVAITGQDLGNPESPEGRRAWEARYSVSEQR